MTDTFRAHNFGAGPGALPLSVLERAQAEFTNFRGSGMSIMELSHRSKQFEQVQTEVETKLRSLLGISDDYDILFLQGGASLQFAMVPLNFLKAGGVGSYVLTGSWSEKALQEADKIGKVSVAATGKDGKYTQIPRADELIIEDAAAYLHVTSNNTIYGTQWAAFPDVEVPLVADMSSDILSRPIDVSKFHLIYAGAQKNLGPSGLTVVLLRRDWLAEANEEIPTMLRYSIHAKNQSRYNTPPTFAIYMLDLMLDWAMEMGGVKQLAVLNQQKADALYRVIDAQQNFYEGHAAPDSRSQMNVTFRLRNADLVPLFLQEAAQQNFVGLAGHRSVGGCRASLYNAVSLASCETLASFMADFSRRHG